jgi:hypothetical protein
MKKLYDFLYQTQVDPANPGRWYTLRPNQPLLDCLSEMNIRSCKLESFVTTYNDYNYTKQAAQFNMTVEEIKSWMLDPEYQRYSDNANSRIAILPTDLESRIRHELAEYLGLVEDTLLMRIQVQAPGEMIALHLDPLKTKLFGAEDEEILRYAWFLEDQAPGQIWIMGETNQPVFWRSGDLVYFDNTKLPHATANVGYNDRYVMIITGTKSS